MSQPLHIALEVVSDEPVTHRVYRTLNSASMLLLAECTSFSEAYATAAYVRAKQRSGEFSFFSMEIYGPGTHTIYNEDHNSIGDGIEPADLCPIEGRIEHWKVAV